MKIAFLGLGRMGTELAHHLHQNHDLTVWNRTTATAEQLTAAGQALAGATVAASAAEAVAGAEMIFTSLFGPDDIRDVVIDTNLIPAGVTWVDTTTVSPAAAADFAAAVPSYVAAPVVGSLGPARAGELGVYVGTEDHSRREAVLEVVAPWAGENKLFGVDSAAKAATGKLLANLALAVTAQGVLEALHLGSSQGLSDEETLSLLDITGLAFMKNMKAPFILGERETSPGDFTVDALCKDAKLIRQTVADSVDLPAVAGAIASFEQQQANGHGDEDFSAIFVHRS